MSVLASNFSAQVNQKRPLYIKVKGEVKIYKGVRMIERVFDVGYTHEKCDEKMVSNDEQKYSCIFHSSRIFRRLYFASFTEVCFV